MMKKVPNVSIIGTGALGSTLAKALSEQSISIKSLFNRSEEGLADLAEIVDADLFESFPTSEEQLGKLIFITVPDDQIPHVVNRFAALGDSFENYFFVHCSGNSPADVLSILSDKGANVASFHPLQTITKTSPPDSFKGIYFNIQGDSKAVALLGNIAAEFEAKWFEVSAQAKPFLHAAAVMASNYLVALLKASGDIAELGGLDSTEVKQAMLPLVMESLRNASSSELSNALTGPIARGDIKTVGKHLKMLEQNPDLLALYKQLGKKALELSKHDKDVAKALNNLLA